MNNWVLWTAIWWGFYGITVAICVLSSECYYWITLVSIILLLVYELIFIKYYLKKKKTGLRALVFRKIEAYTPCENDYNKIIAKLSASISTNSTMARVSFTLLVFSLGFLYLAKISIGFNVNTFLVFGMLLPLLISGICYLIVLDQYDTASDPSIDVDTKWKMRKLGLNFFVAGWYFFIFGLLIGLSLLHPFLTLAGCLAYIFIHNIFWFQSIP